MAAKSRILMPSYQTDPLPGITKDSVIIDIITPVSRRMAVAASHELCRRIKSIHFLDHQGTA